ncbi:hypothetical protein MKX07_004960 [Trichoderma sp. CBMAI-0711]|nr:hypothetical protein MKX07_004960 [Trichoderma sp. CBMAI-0711]
MPSPPFIRGQNSFHDGSSVLWPLRPARDKGLGYAGAEDGVDEHAVEVKAAEDTIVGVEDGCGGAAAEGVAPDGEVRCVDCAGEVGKEGICDG